MKEATSDQNQEIRIHLVRGGRSLDQSILKGCYFYPIEGTDKYDFFSKFDMRLASGVENNKDFVFTLGPFKWAALVDFVLASGVWANTDEDNPAFPRISDGEGEGTFQVQTGGHVPESVSYASA